MSCEHCKYFKNKCVLPQNHGCSEKHIVDTIYQQGRADALKDAKLFNELMEIVRKDDNKIINEYKLKCQKMFRELQFKTGKAWFDFDAGIDRCFEILDKVEKQVKEHKHE